MDPTRIPAHGQKVLAQLYDFDLARRSADPFFSTKPKIGLTPVAGDASGGLFMALADKGEILYVSSEGSGGIVASNFDCMILLLVCHPYWHKLLKYSSGGNLTEMRRAFPVLENYCSREEPQFRQAGEEIRKTLGLPPLTDVVDQLHASVSSTPHRLTVCAPDGSSYGSLFGAYSIERSMAWRYQHRPT